LTLGPETARVARTGGSRVDVHLRPLAGAVRIAIEDDGRGGADGAPGGTVVSAELPA
jgi:hypothetical protein